MVQPHFIYNHTPLFVIAPCKHTDTKYKTSSGSINKSSYYSIINKLQYMDNVSMPCMYELMPYQF